MCYTDLPDVSIDNVEAALPGDNVTLTCNATGVPPLTYQWTMQGSTGSLNADNTTGILTLIDITMDNFGTYICTVSNALGSTASDVILEQASKHILMVGIDVFVYVHCSAIPTTSFGESVSVVEGETLELMVTVEFGVALVGITWTQDGAILVSGTDRVTIENSDLDPPNATSTLTRTDIDRSSDGGVYVLTATNRAGSATATFTVDVLCKSAYDWLIVVYAYILFSIDPPEVTVSASSTRILLNESTTLNCSVLSSNPSTFSVMWTLTNTNNITTTLSETGEILVVSNVGENTFGTYTCNVTNSASLSATAEITIEEGGMNGIELQCH